MKSDYSRGSAASYGLTLCENCGGVAPLTEIVCHGCGLKRRARRPRSISNTLALTTTALLMMIPANLFPIVTTTSINGISSNSILGGVYLLWKHGDVALALVVFFASFVIPAGKIFALYWLVYRVTRSQNTEISSRRATRLYRLLEIVGRWSMVDVFVVAILVALVQLGPLMSIDPGPAALPFSLAVIATMLASMTFDPRLIWDSMGA
jgi:Uncharacterized paraquat-inducible protein A